MHRSKRIISLLLTLSMVLSLLPATALAAGDSTTVPNGVNGFAATAWADGDTSGGHEDAFTAPEGWEAVEIGGTRRSAAFNGKVWADKSVVAAKTPGGEIDHFNVTISALGQTFQSQGSSSIAAALDVAFVLDFSGSMTEDRVTGMTDAANAALKTLMAANNGNNRAGIIAYSGTSAETFWPMDHYTSKTDTEGDFLTNAGSWGNSTTVSTVSGVVNSGGASMTDARKRASGGTPTQAGIHAAGEMLKTAAMAATGVKDTNQPRIPVIILLSDGRPGSANTGYESLNGDAVGGHDGGGIQDGQVAAYTILTANAVKAAVKAAYQAQYRYPAAIDANKIAAFYTIGLDIDADSWTHFVMDPGTQEAMSTQDGDANKGPTSQQVVNDGWEERVNEGGWIPNWVTYQCASAKSILGSEAAGAYQNSYDYATQYFSGSASELSGIFDTIMGEITTGGEIQIPTESVGERQKLTLVEEIGQAFRMAQPFTLTVPTVTAADGVLTAGEPRAYTLEPYSKDGDTPLSGPEAMDAVDKRDGIRLVATQVNGQAFGAELDKYDYAAKNDLKILVERNSNGDRRLTMELPSDLMAYNVLSQKEGKNAYFVSRPVTLTYGLKIREQVQEAGDYLASAVGNTYVQFVPSSQITEDGTYVMPYYWTDGSWNAEGQVRQNKEGSPVEGSASYVYNVRQENNLVQIYLGNNGRVRMEGKDLTFHLYWNDNNDQDGKRYKNMELYLYRETMTGDDSTQPQSVPDKSQLTPVEVNGLTAIPFGSGSALKDEDGNATDLWEQKFTGLPVYDGEGGTYRYWLKMGINGAQPGTETTSYTASIYGPQDGAHGKGYLFGEGEKKGEWMCFSTEQGNVADAELCLQLTHATETMDVTVTKNWTGNTTGKTLPGVQVQLLANGVAQGDHVTLTKTNPDGLTHTWSGLSVYSGGQPIIYDVLELGPVGETDVTYTTKTEKTEASQDAGKTVAFTITNNVVDTLPSTVDLEIVKTWNDGSNQDNKRPESIELTLTGKIGDTSLTDDQWAELKLTAEQRKMTMTGSGDRWTATWNGLPRTLDDGTVIDYSVEETQVEGYVSTVTKVGGYNVFLFNTRTPDIRTITISKEWKDENDRDGKRPATVAGEIYVMNDSTNPNVPTYSRVTNFVLEGEMKESVTLPVNAYGKAVEYYIWEAQVSGYDLTGVSNTTKDTTSAKGHTLYKINDDATEVILTNTHQIATGSYTVEIGWDDANAPGNRPTSITVQITDGTKTYPVTLNLADGTITSAQGSAGVAAAVEGGKLVVSGLPLYKEKNSDDETTVELDYTADVDSAHDGYTIRKSEGKGWAKFTFSKGTATADLVLTKTWDDNGNDQGKRPTASDFVKTWLKLQKTVGGVTTEIQNPALSYNGIPNGETWTITYKNLPMYEGGQLVTYSVVETIPNENYKVNDTNTATVNFVNNQAALTNTFSGEMEVYTTVTVTKSWSDDSNDGNTRPAFPENYAKGGAVNDPLGMVLYKVGEASTAGQAPDAITQDTANDTWVYTWNNVPKYAGGKLVNYVAKETTIPDGYTPVGSAEEQLPGNSDPAVAALSGAITNTLTAGAEKTGSLTINKVWANEDGYNVPARPASLSFTIYGVVQGSTTAQAHPVTMVAPAEQDGAWTVTKEDLPVYRDGQLVRYYVVENAVPSKYTVGYSVTSEDPVPLTGDGESFFATVTVTNTYVPGTKYLTYDANGGMNTPPDDVRVPEGTSSVTVSDQGELHYPGAVFLGWSKTEYPLLTAAPDLSTIIQPDSNLEILENTTLYAVWAKDENGDGNPDYNETEVTVHIVWDDAMNQDGLRPDSVTVRLMKDGAEYAVKTLALTEDSGVVMSKDGNNTVWSYTWSHLPLEGSYTVTEDAVTGYTTTVSAPVGNVVTITNTHVPAVTTHTVTKTWDHTDASVTQRPATAIAKVQLLANGQPVGDPVTLDLANTTYTWNDLPQYDQGVEITYHAVEVSATSDLVANGAGSYRVDYVWDDLNQTTQIKNTYGQTRDVTVLYTWDDNNSTHRPQAVTVELYAATEGGTPAPVEGQQPLTLSGDNGWTADWTGLPITRPAPDGGTEEIHYYVVVTGLTDEAGIDHTVSVDPGSTTLGGGYDFAYRSIGPDGDNTVVLSSELENLPQTLTVTKAWNVPQGLDLPERVYLQVFANGVQETTVKLTAAMNWTSTVTVPTNNANGDPITYTVKEIPVWGYISEVNGLTVTNTPEGWTPGGDPEVTVIFHYTNAYAEDQNGAPIAAETAIKVPFGSDYTFTAKAEEGYMLNPPSKVGGGTLTILGNDQYTLTNLTSNVDVTITGGKTGTDTVTVTYVYNNIAQERYTQTLAKGSLAANFWLRPDDYAAGNSEYAFQGWFADEALTVPYDFRTPVESNLILYAKWVKDTPAPVPGLSVDKRLTAVNNAYWTGGLVEVGDVLTYVITVTNTGAADLANVQVTDLLPALVSLVSATPGYQIMSQGYLTWMVPALAPGASASFEVTVQVLPSAEGKAVTNSATASGGGANGSDGDTVWVDKNDPPIIVPSDPGTGRPTLNTQDHMAYIVGYEDGTVRPRNNITRAEVATIFFRLLTEESRGMYWSQTNSYSDVAPDAWYNNAVSTMSNAGILTGYPDGTFRPDAPITRAEFATIAARFSGQTASGAGSFTDVPGSHWAAQYIATAQRLGWIAGYPDGSFRPDQPINRAEAVTLINRMLERAVEPAHMLPAMVTWSDCAVTDWYYDAIQEATNSHTYARLPQIVPGQSFSYEDWQEILPVPNWSALEKTWSRVG